MGTLKKLAGQTAIYGLSSILGRSINFLLIIVYTGYLSKADLGAFTGIYALIGFLNIVFTYGMETAFLGFQLEKIRIPHEYITTRNPYWSYPASYWDRGFTSQDRFWRNG